MANAYFCNCVADEIAVNLNNQLAPTQVNSRALDAVDDINKLPMAVFPIIDAGEREKGKFSADTGNTVVVNFATLRDSATYEITADKSVAGNDLYFYVFENTLVGQDQVGKSAGISIQAHETIKKLIQSGTEISNS